MTIAPRSIPRHGFTLMELLVVISIIAILTSILLSGVKIARNAAKSARCTSSLRQIILGVNGYALDWDGMVVPHFNPAAVRWFSNLAPYLSANSRMTASYDDGGLQKTNSVLWGCPVFNVDYNAKLRGGSGQIGYGLMHGMNATAPEPGYPLGSKIFYTNWADLPTVPATRDGTIAELTNQSQRILIGETWDWYLDASWSGAKPVLANLNSAPVLFNRSDARRHGGRANYAFVDGHAGSLTGDQAAWGVLDPLHAK